MHAGKHRTPPQSPCRCTLRDAAAGALQRERQRPRQTSQSAPPQAASASRLLLTRLRPTRRRPARCVPRCSRLAWPPRLACMRCAMACAGCWNAQTARDWHCLREAWQQASTPIQITAPAPHVAVRLRAEAPSCRRRGRGARGRRGGARGGARHGARQGRAPQAGRRRQACRRGGGLSGGGFRCAHGSVRRARGADGRARRCRRQPQGQTRRRARRCGRGSRGARAAGAAQAARGRRRRRRGGGVGVGGRAGGGGDEQSAAWQADQGGRGDALQTARSGARNPRASNSCLLPGGAPRHALSRPSDLSRWCLIHRPPPRPAGVAAGPAVRGGRV